MKSQLVTYSNGYGYEFSIGDFSESDLDAQVALPSDCSDDINWVISNFGGDSASRLELISTLVFALCDKQKRLGKNELIERVHEIKPHFSKEIIGEVADEIEGILDCVNCGTH